MARDDRDLDDLQTHGPGDDKRLKSKGIGQNVPGPSNNPATNLLIHDVGMRAAARLFRSAVERGLLKNRFSTAAARQIVSNRSLGMTLVSYGLSRVATKSVPGAAVVGGGLLAKTLFDRGRKRRHSKREGDKALAEMADD